MNYFHWIAAKSYQSFKIIKQYPGQLKISGSIISGKLSLYLLTDAGFSQLSQRVSFSETRLKEDICGNFIKTANLNSGEYVLVFHNKSPKALSYEFTTEENFEPPILSGGPIGATGGMPF